MTAGKKRLILGNEEEFPETWRARRCIAIKKKTGMRCNNYAVEDRNVCTYHGAGYRATRMKYKFKNTTLHQAYEKLASDPDRLDLGEELALARLVLQTLTDKIGDKLTADSGEGLVSLTRSIGDLARTMAIIEKDIRQTVNAEQLKHIADQFLLVVMKHVDDKEVLGRIQDDLGRIAVAVENPACTD
jgi:hypothetical protein